MPTLPEDKGQAKEAQHNSSPPAKDTTVEGTTCSTPSIVLPEDAVTPDTEIDKNLVNRPRSPHRRHSNRATRNSTSSLTSVDNSGHVIDLVNDPLPDVKISEEDKKKNLELLEEAKKVSERFLTRRGRKSRSSLTESPTGSDAYTTTSIEPVSPGQVRAEQSNAAKGLIDRRQNDQRKISQGRLVPRSAGFENSKEKLSDQKENFDPRKHMDTLPKFSSSAGDGGRMSLNTCMNVCENELGKSFLKKGKENDVPLRTHLPGPGIGNMDSKLKIPVPEMKDHKVPCKPEFKLCGLRPPLLRAVSWDSLEPGQKEKTPLKLPSEEDKSSVGNKSSNQLKAFKDLQIQVQPVRMQKLTKLREEHILMRNQNLVGLKLPELSEAAEQEKGPSPLPSPTEEEETKNSSDVMPSIPDVLLRKLRVHKSLPGSSPPLTEKEVENVFVQLSLAFRNDSYTLESRIQQAERERNLTEENAEKELENFKAAITSSAHLWHHYEHREAYQKLLEDIAVLRRLAARLSSRAEMVGAVRQEKRMSKATEVMMQYVENLKRTYEKDHAELMEFKKLANQNSSRSYGASEDGVPRSSRSMSLTVGKNMPRRRVSVAVVPKFNSLNIPGQSPTASPIPSMPSLSESPSNGRSNLTSTPALPALLENGKSNGEPDCETSTSVLTQSGLEEISPETKAKIEEEAYNKGYQEALKKAKELQELKELKEEDEETPKESHDEHEESENEDEIKNLKSRIKGIGIYLDQKANFSEASNGCNKFNLELATKKQVEEALKHGFETCNFGWVKEGSAVIPRITSNQKCGQGKTGIVQWNAGKEKKFHLYCFNSSDVQINSCHPDPTTTTFPSSTASRDFTAYSASDLTENITAVPTVTVTGSGQFLRKRFRIICVTETILPTEGPTTPEPEEHSPTDSPKHTPHLAFKNDAVVFGGIPTALLILAIIFFIISVVLGVCYVKKYKKTLPFLNKNQQKETVVTTALKETKPNDQTPEKETQNNGNKINKTSGIVEASRILNLYQFTQLYKDITSQAAGVLAQSDTSEEAAENWTSLSSCQASLWMGRVKQLTDEEECCICMDGRADLILPCAHSFCQKCIDKCYLAYLFGSFKAKAEMEEEFIKRSSN
ncbi:hypothetical protein HGM15179_011176 [Zosterops borbonicus]|uniref:RING finger protein 141 n=1 Tax=Zosterops borbonicus TaxID=364589 RepID=A0A8K1GDU7_9PASS|nr:hypothetical protein HGM15179_011176 [Zosterops borbonicus]